MTRAQPLLRVEDGRLLAGRGRFVDDVDLPGQLWLRVIRSQVAHANLREVDTGAARASERVHAVVTAADLPEIDRIPVRVEVAGQPLDAYLQPVLARERVRYVGEPVAVVLAEDPYAAEDAAELVAIGYEELPAVLDLRAAERAAELEMGYGDVEVAFANAAHVTRAEFTIGRHSAVPLETRGLLAAPRDGRLEIWGTTKVPHFNRRVLASMLGIPVEQIRLHTADAGGGFGVRGEFYPEDYLVPWLAHRTDRPVKWIEDRSEHLVATNHSRHQIHAIEAAFDDRHRLLAIADEVWHDTGAYIRTHGVLVADLTLSMLPGPYRVPAYRGAAHVVLTARTPCGTYRGPGRYEGTLTIDVGDVGDLLERTIAEAGFDAWRDESARLRARGRMVGIGAAIFMEKSGLGPLEHAGVDLLPSGEVRVTAGATSLGQGVETVLATLAAERLALDADDITVVLGDTDLVPEGTGSWASRSTVLAGNAVALAADRVAELAREAAAEALVGRFEAAGSRERAVSLVELAGRSGGLSARETFEIDRMTYPYGVHLAHVEVDPDSGGVRILGYFIGYEVGRAVIPALVEGQLVGGAAQGIAGALMEEFRYTDDGQPLATTLADYLVPTAGEVPPIGVLISEDWPAESNALGVRGAGEGGATGCGAAIAAAVDDAIGRPGRVRALPILLPELREAIRERGDVSGRPRPDQRFETRNR